MASPVLKSLLINFNSNYNTQSKISKPISNLFKDLITNKESNASSFTKFSPNSSTQSFN